LTKPDTLTNGTKKDKYALCYSDELTSFGVKLVFG